MNKIITGMFIAVGVMVVVVMVYALMKFDNRVEECDSQNGIMVKTVNGWSCLDVTVKNKI